MAMAIGVLGAVVSAVGQYTAMQAQAEAAEYNAEVAERNRRAVLGQTALDISDERLHNRRVIGSMRAAFGANGFAVAGSPLDVLSDTVQEQEYDIAKKDYAGKLKAEGYTEQANLYKMEADASRTAGVIGLASGLLGGFGSAISNSAGSSPLAVAV